MSQSTPDISKEKARFKRKRKKSFLKNAKKYGKKGCYGRGSHLEPDTYHYLVRIMEVYREGFETEEDKSIFVNNVFEQTEKQEIHCCCNQVGCRVVELLLPFANAEVLQRYMDALGQELRPLCSDRFASHVVEALVTEAAARSLKPDADGATNCKEFVLKVSKFLLNNLEDYLWDMYGNHVVRACVGALAQIPKPTKQKQHGKCDGSDVKIELPEEYVSVVKDYGERIMCWPQFKDLCGTEVTSGFLQVLLRALRKTNKKVLRSLTDKLIMENFAPEGEEMSKEKFPNIFLSASGVMVLETCLEVSKAKKITQMYLKCFTGRLVKLAVTRSTNFTVQKLITNCREKYEFETIFDELADSFKDIIKAGHTGVIWALGEGCKKLSTRQGSFVQNLMKSLDCFQPEERQYSFVWCLCKFVDFSTMETGVIDIQKEKLNLHGTLLLQLMLSFNKPIKIVHSILSMEQNELKGLFSNSMGSHIVDSYVTGEFVGEKSRDKLVRKMRGIYQDLATTKYGSRSFEAIWNVASFKNKQAIMEELVCKDGLWSNSEYGKIISGKINLPLYKRNKNEWMNSLNTMNKAEQLFKDILK